ncbi:hypothetical protein BU23DRAFT_597504 [Bimuria novae-zelandiae CBS 107.79]|uniref:Uncharacterized protein n=1 Tax=Bimuria novae-zelandiae CBS 107.79 TaxID=1447943 RepID=A0A6A5VIV7_9PLEO|nr:hypothetical protein BU23DRAFT_597504 [Bimuria novae-zelandiae CBS 107.79]
MLEDIGDGPVSEKDVLGRAGESGRTYWVKDVPQQVDTGKKQELHGVSSQGGPVAQDFAFEDDDRSSPTSEYSNADLYAPPTPLPKPKRSDSLRYTYFEPIYGSPDQFIGQDQRSRNSFIFRGGGGTVEPVPFQFNLSPNVLGGIDARAQADSLRHGSPKDIYTAKPSATHKESGESAIEAGMVRGTTPNYSLPLEYPSRRPSTAELENAYGTFTPEAEPSQPHDKSQTEATELEAANERQHSASVAENTPNAKEERASLSASTSVPAVAPNIADHPAIRENTGTESAIPADKVSGVRSDHFHSPQPIRPNDGKPPAPHLKGIPIEIEEEWPPTHQLDTPDSHHKRHSLFSLRRIYSPPSTPSDTSHSHSRPSGLATDDEVEDYIMRATDHEPNPYRKIELYERTLTTQAKSIQKLHRLVDELTNKRDYYEEHLLPNALAHWTNTNKENHALAAAVRDKEMENAMLWDLLEFSRKLLSLCWEREEAVLHTARTMRLQKINRANCSLLERLVNSFGPGRGGGGRGRKDIGGGSSRSWSRKRLESPFHNDLEQLVFVCEQNMRLLGEDLQDWSGNLSAVQEMREEQEGKKGEEEETPQAGFRDM